MAEEIGAKNTGEGKIWRCGRCQCDLVPKKVVLDYMGYSISHDLPVCPTCGKVVVVPQEAVAVLQVPRLSPARGIPLVQATPLPATVPAAPATRVGFVLQTMRVPLTSSETRGEAGLLARSEATTFRR